MYNAADDDLERLQHAVADHFLHENALNPFAYPTLLRMEQEIVEMAADLLGGPPRAGALTSGVSRRVDPAVLGRTR